MWIGPSLGAETNAAIRAALEAAGVEFISENGGGAGVRLRDRTDGPPRDTTRSEAPEFMRGRTARRMP
jgi:hypothetical protein